jgi:predicted AlkP superfamily pyrophosphatase or phosphodiesterase
MRRLVLTLCAAALACSLGVVRAAPAPSKLAVILVVDQMRADYVPRFKGDWTAGLRRLVDGGAVFTRAAYPYLTTVTCAGHATISTGAFPHRSGIFQNAWWDRNRARMTTCTEDRSVKPIVYDKDGGGDDDSAVNLMVPTFADLMRTERQAHVVTLSIKARSAIMLAGHGGDAVTWLSESLDRWQTSSAFAKAAVPQVRAFVLANPIEADYGRTWDRLLPVARYHDRDDDEAEAPPKGWTRTFPHVLKGDGNDTKPDEEFYAQWERSPFGDAYLGRMASALVDSMQLGRHETTDVLAISFSSPDVVGHAFGPRSQEVQDLYARLDRTVGELLERLDAVVGRDGYTLALTADHGVTDIPEHLKRSGKDGGRLDTRVLAAAVNERAKVTLGPGTYVARINGNDVYLMPGVYANLTKSRGGIAGLIQILAAQQGVSRVFYADELLKGSSSPDALLRAAALSYVPGRSGDLVLAPKPGWMFSTTGTTHGSANADDQAVPLIFYGRGIKPGHYDAAATPADIAPTLAALFGIALPEAEGTVLRDAVAEN